MAGGTVITKKKAPTAPAAGVGAFEGPLPTGSPAAVPGALPAPPSAAQQAALDAAINRVGVSGPAFVADMSPADKLVMQGSGQATAVAQGIQGMNTAGNTALTGLQGQLAATPGQTPIQNLQNAPATNPALYTAGALQGRAPVAATGAPTLGGKAAQLPQGLYTQPGLTPLSAGQGQAGLDAVDARLAGYDPNFAVPTAGVPGAGANVVHLGALPGATDRTLQTSQLDRVLGYNPATASAAEAQLQNAGVTNLGQSLALARSARGGPAAQAQAMRNAQAEGAATMSQQARDMAVLRAKEEDTAKERELTALGLGNDVTGAIRSSDVTERGNDVAAQVAELNAGSTQRGQTLEQQNAERAAGVTERGQTLTANQAMSKAQLDALIAQQQGAISGRNAAVTERGQTLQTDLGAEGIKQARDAVTASSLTEAEKTEAQIIMTQAQLGYDLTPEQQATMLKLRDKLSETNSSASPFEQFVNKWVKPAVETVQPAAGAAIEAKKAGLV